ncbi:hypothetical protein BCR35DRAFT_303465 [Leucosporidium creatinivorum]|uniref:CsbD-like domain-containing protein n=1 Tax=Leucosporidium creatinivorum TaxID=106004 RepID=A0A1Y2FJM5_9BASI|nr:hypothetical protein BCR35DRAFT_303465 [Leucosporidium creatinivorum]
MSDEQPSKINAAWNSTVGSIKETYGAAVGASGLEAAGRDQAAQGEVESNAAQAQAYAEGTADRLGGKLDRVVGAVTGDIEQQQAGEAQESKGKAQQEAHA